MDPTETDVPSSVPHILVAIFSATGHTAPLAEYAADLLGADLYEIIAADPYTEADLAYYTGGRCDQEQDDPSVRPAISGKVENMDQYDIVLIGHPIWHGQAPRIISTFLESYDFSGKTLVTFCTSHSVGLGSSASNLYGLVPESVTWLESRRFPIGASKDDVAGWLKEIGLLDTEQEKETTMETKNQIILTVNGHELTATLTENSSAEALKELIANGPVTISMRDYGSMEKVGDLGTSLPTNDEQITTEAGDLILYMGSAFVIYYAPNSWNFTQLGKIDDITASELKEILGSGSVQVILSLPNE